MPRIRQRHVQPPNAVAALRERNGRPSRRKVAVKAREALSEVDAMSVAREARRRMFPDLPVHWLDLADAGRPNVGTLHGVMRLKGMAHEMSYPDTPLPLACLSADQFSAAEKYIGARLAWRRSIEAAAESGPPPPPNPDAELDREAAHEAFVVKARRAWDAMRSCLHRAGIGCYPAVDMLAEGKQMEPWRLVYLRQGLDAVWAEFGAGKRR